MIKRFSHMEKLPDEILESQKARIGLLRWKLVICAVIGAVGFGVEKNSHPMYILLALIPLACLYVDLLCTNINLRIILIGKYLSTQNDPYESYVTRHRIMFSLEDWALYGSTVVASILLFLFSLVKFIICFSITKTLMGVFESVVIGASSVIAVYFSKLIVEAYEVLLNHKPVEKGENAREKFGDEMCKKARFFCVLVGIFKMITFQKKPDKTRGKV